MIPMRLVDDYNDVYPNQLAYTLIHWKRSTGLTDERLDCNARDGAFWSKGQPRDRFQWINGL